MFDIVRGVVRARAWPKPRGAPRTIAEALRQEWFRDCQWASKFLVGEAQTQIYNARRGTPILPRDLQMMMFADTLAYITSPDGRKWYPQVAIDQVSKSLDALCQIPGSMLVRDIDRWRGQPVPTPGNEWWWSPPDTTAWTYGSSDAEDLTVSYDQSKGTAVNGGPPATIDTNRAIWSTLSYPSANWSLDYRFDFASTNQNYAWAGLMCRDGPSGRYTMFGLQQSTGPNVMHWTNFGVFASNSIPTLTSQWQQPMPFSRLEFNGSSLTWSKSLDAVNYIEIYSEGVDEFLLAAPNQIGVVMGGNRATGEIVGNVSMWRMT